MSIKENFWDTWATYWEHFNSLFFMKSWWALSDHWSEFWWVWWICRFIVRCGPGVHTNAWVTQFHSKVLNSTLNESYRGRCSATEAAIAQVSWQYILLLSSWINSSSSPLCWRLGNGRGSLYPPWCCLPWTIRKWPYPDAFVHPATSNLKNCLSQ